MDITPKDIWCTCEPLDAEEAVFVEGHGSYPPKAGQGFRRGSSISPVQSKQKDELKDGKEYFFGNFFGEAAVMRLECGDTFIMTFSSLSIVFVYLFIYFFFYI